eukprot:m.303108 g.303108  ORF g.303108 m.303108 type:complete len:211 (-) comp16320_c0_seq4:1190-1822(-)
MNSRVQKVLEAGDLVLIRHGKTEKAVDDTPEADKARVVNAVGRAQCASARAGWLQSVLPVGLVLHSEAGRTAETARELLKEAGECETAVLHSLYGGMNSQTGKINHPELEALFADYLPLRDYQVRLKTGFSEYTDRIFEEMLPKLEPPPKGTTVIVSHAVYVSALACAVASAAGFSEDEQAIIRDVNVGEVSGFRISLKPRGITYVGETL